MQALILAGGLGTRLKDLTKAKPKPMLEFNGKPLLEHLIGWLKANGVTDIVITIGYLGEIIKDYFGDGKRFGVKILYSEEKELLGTGGAIKNAEKLLEDEFFAMNGDTFFPGIDLKKLKGFHNNNRSVFTLALTGAPSEDNDAIQTDKQGKVKAILLRGTKEAAEYRKQNPYCVNSGVYYCSKKVLDYIPPNTKISLEKEVFPVLIKRANVYALSFKTEIIDIGTPDRYEKARKMFN